MDFNGFQKLTLLDYPEKVACTLFLAGCNFRCPFCHNAFLVTDIDNSITFSEEEILSYLKKRKGILEGVCITGGEPLLRPDLEEFIKKVKEIGLCVKLDTNGTDPERLLSLIDSGLLDYVAMDIKSSPENYGRVAGVSDLDILPIQKSVEILKRGKIPYEFRTTIVKELHTLEDMEKIGAWIKGAERYFLQNFVDSGNLIQSNLHEHDKEALEKMLKIVRKFVPNAEIRGI
ncbi:MAG: anaerobic ribonucleoside-triphosphate reductase activating protein [Clostridia bacterium]|nr:anaerobic ribonucleoside-triphosphate reductase activating protein [Clostridia bacterium]